MVGQGLSRKGKIILLWLRNQTPKLRRSLEHSNFSVGMSETQCKSPPDRSYMFTTNHVNSFVNKLPKLYNSYFVSYWSLMCKINKVQSQTGELIPEMILLEDRSLPLASPLRQWKLKNIASACKLRRGLSVSTQAYSTSAWPPFIPMNTAQRRRATSRSDLPLHHGSIATPYKYSRSLALLAL